MKTLRSFVEGRWHTASEGFVPLYDPCSEEEIARASSRGIDFGAALDYARERGGPALRGLGLSERGELLARASRALQAHRDELIALSLRNTGATRKDAKFDVDGGIYTLAYYGSLGKELGAGSVEPDGPGIRLGRSSRFWGQHLWVPLRGVAVQINAFNFPVWGLAEKAACALLAGMPVISKPATSTAWVAERAAEILIESGDLPDGALSFVCGSTGDLVDRLGPRDVLAFTGSARTALGLRGKENLLAASTRVNVEADSLNAAVLGPDAAPGGETWNAFVRDVVREMTQKTGQKCTAVRRICVPAERSDAVVEALTEALSAVVTGNPEASEVTMGPLATRAQLDDALGGLAELAEEADVVLGQRRRIDGAGNPEGRGWFLEPHLLRAPAGSVGNAVHRLEVFGPAATVIEYDGAAESAAELVERSEGSLVTSLYTDEREFLERFVARGAASAGRLYTGSEKVAGMLPGSGVAMPDLLHGGPGRAGGGTELGGARGLRLYQQRVALTGDRGLVERVAGVRE